MRLPTSFFPVPSRAGSGWPGLGRLVVESIFLRNYPLVQAAILFYAVTYVALNFLADILYTVLNPRVRL